MRCLVIEDEADTARYICNGLGEAGHTATLVRDGVGGLDLATNEHWDIIILDRMLPGVVDGLSIIATLRDLGKTTPVLILSALASLDERVRGLRVEITRMQLQFGAVNYLSLLTAQNTYQTALIALVQAQAARYADTAALFQALGGGWWNREDVPLAKRWDIKLIP